MNSKELVKVSVALWVPLTGYALASSRSLYRWLYPEGNSLVNSGYIEGNPLDRAVYSALIAAGLLILFKRKIDWSNLIRANAWILLLFIYMGLSIFWSEFRDVSFKRLIKAAGDLIMVLVVLTEINALHSVSTLLKRCFYVYLPLSIIMIKYFRTIGVAWSRDGMEEMWVGVSTHKNVLGEVCMISAIFLIWNMTRDRSWKNIFVNLIFISMSLWLLNGSNTSHSSTSIFVFLIGVLMLVSFYFMRSSIEHLRRNIIIFVFICGFLVIISQLTLAAFTNKTLLSASVEASGRDMTFTGRTELWTDMLNIASENPVLGVGYGSFWIGDVSNNLWEKHPWKPEQGHNGYIDVYVELGLVGIFILAGVIICAFKNIMKGNLIDFDVFRLRIIFLTMILFHNITESSFLRGTHNLWFIFLLVVVSAPRTFQPQICRSGNV